MAKMSVISRNPSMNKDGQFISIPFMWEETPGIPKKGWIPIVRRRTEEIAAPVKFIASIPFQWEEKPGKPLPCFYQSPVTPLDVISPLSPPRYSEDEDSSMVDGNNEISGLELDVNEFYSDDSFSSSTSLIANGLISTWEISNAISVEEIVEYGKDRGELHRPLSPASQAESSTSSYATGSAKEGALISRPSTLEELIMMSRRRTYQEKDHFMDIRKKEEFGCCMFGLQWH